MTEIEVKALIEKYAHGIYIGRQSKPPMSVCIQHMEEFVRELDAIRSTPTAAPVRVPDGWQLVPKKPTEEMASKGADAFFSPQPQSTEDENARAASVYLRMLSASPSPVDSRDTATPAEIGKDRSNG